MINDQTPGKLVIISGPAGAGKSTVVRKLIEQCPLPLVLSVSATTRPRRDGEEDGIHYHFLSQDQFDQLRERGEFLESKEVFGRGYWYGTLRNEVSSGLAAGKWVILEIDVEGMIAVQPQFPNALTLFVHPGSLEELERRLRARGTESEESIRRRLEVAPRELALRTKYQHEIINDRIDRAVREICDVLENTKNE